MVKPKIIISSYDDIANPYYGGGGAVAIHELAQRLTKKFDVKVMSWDHSGMKQQQIDGVTYERVGFSFLPPKLSMFIFQICLPLFALFQQYDLWIESFGPPFTTSFLPLFARRPVIGVVHMLAAADMKRKYAIDLSFIERFGLRQYRNIVATNNSVCDSIKSMNPKCKCLVISNGVPAHLAQKGKVRKRKQILFLGRIEVDQKGLDLLIQAFERFVRKSSVSYQLVIVGSGLQTEIKKLQSLIDKSGVQKQIVIKRRTVGKEKEQLLQQSTCLVLPSRFETYGLVALEAMALGTPVICFDIEGLRWTPNGSVLKAKAFDVPSLAQMIEKIIGSRSLQESLREQGKAYAQHFSWDSISQKYQNYIDEILAHA